MWRSRGGTHRSLPPIDVLIKQVDFGDLRGEALETERGRLQEKMQDLLNDAKARNAGYSRLARALTKPVPEGVLAKWTAEKSDEKRKFIFMAQYEILGLHTLNTLIWWTGSPIWTYGFWVWAFLELSRAPSSKPR